ncbi:MAG: 4-(cytidine 5'-diphospho)-2-C-methyl-D-erythritol kinase [Candidatus Omnitrophota bacterium]|jgi:4-diphosphocytidyl-2-C-methyl-D-erythritol kinase
MKRSFLPCSFKSFAKLNLYLQVLKKRKDNFHNLNTLFVRIGLADTLFFKERRDGRIKVKCDRRDLSAGKTNLCYRAAELLKKNFCPDRGIEIRLNKRIPIGAGLGGGSSDAAGVLLALNKAWQLGLSTQKLAELGAKLGSDVPFFIYQAKFALGKGKGDRIEPLQRLGNIKLWFILVYPGFKVSTPRIYRELDFFRASGGFAAGKSPSGGREKISKIAAIKQDPWLTRPAHNVKMLISRLPNKGKAVNPRLLFNSLEIITGHLYPEVVQVKNVLSGMGLDKVMMSGSGPAVFAICDSCRQARNLKSKLHKKYKSWQIFAVPAV